MINVTIQKTITMYDVRITREGLVIAGGNGAPVDALARTKYTVDQLTKQGDTSGQHLRLTLEGFTEGESHSIRFLLGLINWQGEAIKKWAEHIEVTAGLYAQDERAPSLWRPPPGYAAPVISIRSTSWWMSARAEALSTRSGSHTASNAQSRDRRPRSMEASHSEQS